MWQNNDESEKRIVWLSLPSYHNSIFACFWNKCWLYHICCSFSWFWIVLDSFKTIEEDYMRGMLPINAIDKQGVSITRMLEW
jgi:hypothetical protein